MTEFKDPDNIVLTSALKMAGIKLDKKELELILRTYEEIKTKGDNLSINDFFNIQKAVNEL